MGFDGTYCIPTKLSCDYDERQKESGVGLVGDFASLNLATPRGRAPLSSPVSSLFA